MNKRYMKGKWLLMLLICIAILYPIHTQAAKTAINSILKYLKLFKL